MAIEKISGITPISNVSNRINPKVQQVPPGNPKKVEKVVNEQSGKTKDATKVVDPPFLPIGDTWSIFKK